MMKSVIRALIILLSVFFISCASNDEPVRDSERDIVPAQPIKLTLDQKRVVNNYNDFAVRLMDKIASGSKDNVVISPMSVTMALSMVAQGACGNTLDEFTALWGLDSSDLDEMNNLNKVFLDELPSVDDNSILRPANSIWINESLNSVQPTFLNKVKDFYDAEVQCVSFKTVHEKVNEWVERKTDGMIKDILDNAPDGPIVLANALYFKSFWTMRFDNNLTKSRPFHNADGEMREVSMMDGGENLYEYKATSDAEIVTLPYGNGAFRMQIIMPREGIEPSVSLDNGIYEEMSHVRLRIPRFDVSSKYNLSGILAEMGLKSIADDSADLSGISPGVKSLNAIIHEARVLTEEEGVKASSATVIANYGSSGIKDYKEPEPKLVTINRPFMFVISERSSGVIMFKGRINYM